MHVDCSLPLWAFFDIYGTTNKIESLGTALYYVVLCGYKSLVLLLIIFINKHFFYVKIFVLNCVCYC